MIDRNFMYGTEHDPEITESSTKTSVTGSDLAGKMIIESNGKKVEVVTVREYERLKLDHEDTKKQVKILKTEIQNMKKFINKLAKTIDGLTEKVNARFN